MQEKSIDHRLWCATLAREDNKTLRRTRILDYLQQSYRYKKKTLDMTEGSLVHAKVLPGEETTLLSYSIENRFNLPTSTNLFPLTVSSRGRLLCACVSTCKRSLPPLPPTSPHPPLLLGACVSETEFGEPPI